MKINNLKYISLLVLPILLFSCSKGTDDELRAKGEGLLSLNFGFDLDATVVTKAEDVPTFKIVVANSAGVAVKTIEDHTTLSSDPIKLKAGEYVITATNGTDVDAAFDSPFYMGKETVTIESGKTASASLNCTLANVKTSVVIGESIKGKDEQSANFSEYKVTISNDLASLVFDEEHLASHGYFKCTGSLSWTINLTNTDGEEFSMTDVIANVQPREYYRLIFEIGEGGKEGEGGATLRVTSDNTLNSKVYDIGISLNKKKMPIVTEATGASLSSTLYIPQKETVTDQSLGKILVTSEAGVSAVKLSHNDQALTALGLPSSIDLLNSGEGSYSSYGISWTNCFEGSTSLSIDLRELFAKKLAIASDPYSLDIYVLDAQAQYASKTLTVKVVPDMEITTGEINAWAKFAYIDGTYYTESQPEGLGFQYKKSSETEWTTFAGNIAVSGTKFSAKITGLTPSTTYYFRAISAKDQDPNAKQATTEAAAQLPNFNFDSWVKSGRSWYPDADIDANFFWDSGNDGANTLGEVNPTSPESSFVHTSGGKSVKMVSTMVAGLALAGGNIYTGDFIKRTGLGAQLDFGRPYTCRPVALEGWYSYSPVAINNSKEPYLDKAGTMDVAKIFVVLADWSAPFRVNTNDKVFLDPFTDPGVIAYGELEDGVGTNGEYKKFHIDLKYNDINRKVTHVVLVATASKYADYFTGGAGSTMYIDDFEFLFE